MDSGQKTAPLFSVVIPLYNKADTIARTVRSVEAQTFNDWELIVVNDGSTDDSLSVAKQLSKDIPMRIIDKPNGGVSSARNAGAAVASGMYIALLDGDDVWFPNHLALLADAIEKHPDVKFFGTGYERVFGKCVYYTIPWGGSHVKDVYSVFRYGQPINSSSVAVESGIWKKVCGFNESISFYEDYEFFFRLGIDTDCCVIREVSVRYMDDALTHATQVRRNVSRVTRPHLAFIDDRIRDSLATSEMIAFARSQFELLAYASYTGKIIDSIEELMKSFPYILHHCGMIRSFRKQARIWFVLQMLVFIVYYKFRCHLIIWFKHV